MVATGGYKARLARIGHSESHEAPMPQNRGANARLNKMILRANQAKVFPSRGRRRISNPAVPEATRMPCHPDGVSFSRSFGTVRRGQHVSPSKRRTHSTDHEHSLSETYKNDTSYKYQLQSNSSAQTSFPETRDVPAWLADTCRQLPPTNPLHRLGPAPATPSNNSSPTAVAHGDDKTSSDGFMTYQGAGSSTSHQDHSPAPARLRGQIEAPWGNLQYDGDPVFDDSGTCVHQEVLYHPRGYGESASPSHIPRCSSSIPYLTLAPQSDLEDLPDPPVIDYVQLQHPVARYMGSSELSFIPELKQLLPLSCEKPEESLKNQSAEMDAISTALLAQQSFILPQLTPSTMYHDFSPIQTPATSQKASSIEPCVPDTNVHHAVTPFPPGNKHSSFQPYSGFQFKGKRDIYGDKLIEHAANASSFPPIPALDIVHELRADAIAKHRIKNSQLSVETDQPPQQLCAPVPIRSQALARYSQDELTSDFVEQLLLGGSRKLQASICLPPYPSNRLGDTSSQSSFRNEAKDHLESPPQIPSPLCSSQKQLIYDKSAARRADRKQGREKASFSQVQTFVPHISPPRKVFHHSLSPASQGGTLQSLIEDETKGAVHNSSVDEWHKNLYHGAPINAEDESVLDDCDEPSLGPKHRSSSHDSIESWSNEDVLAFLKGEK